jgi:hypothetical protein
MNMSRHIDFRPDRVLRRAVEIVGVAPHKQTNIPRRPAYISGSSDYPKATGPGVSPLRAGITPSDVAIRRAV